MTEQLRSKLVSVSEVAAWEDDPRGIYLIFDHEELVYVGQSIRMRSRIGDHFRPRSKLDPTDISWKTDRYLQDNKKNIKIQLLYFNRPANLDLHERKYIDLFKPSLNKKDNRKNYRSAKHEKIVTKNPDMPNMSDPQFPNGYYLIFGQKVKAELFPDLDTLLNEFDDFINMEVLNKLYFARIYWMVNLYFHLDGI